MAVFDLKHATIYLEDGSAATSKINHTAGYTSGASSIVIDTLVPSGFEVEVGQEFTISGDTTVYTVTSKSPSSGATTTVGFTPVLASSAADNADITFGPRRLEVGVGEGNFSYDEAKNREYILDRGAIDTVRDGDEAPIDVTLDFKWEYITGPANGTPTVEDVLKKTGQAANWTSSASDACEPYAVDIRIVYDPGCGADGLEEILLPDFRYEKLSHNARDGQVSCTGKCNALEAVATRSS